MSEHEYFMDSEYIIPKIVLRSDTIVGNRRFAVYSLIKSKHFLPLAALKNISINNSLLHFTNMLVISEPV
jgi:hypothetical protein